MNGRPSVNGRSTGATNKLCTTLTDFQRLANLDFHTQCSPDEGHRLDSPWILSLPMSPSKRSIPSRALLNLNMPHLSLSTCWLRPLSVLNLMRQVKRGQRYILSWCLGLAR